MKKLSRQALLLFLLFTILTGAIFPALVTVSANLIFPEQSRGSLVFRDGIPVGSRLIGQPFDDPGYFWSRLSATSPPYNAAASSGSNLGPLNPAFMDAVTGRIAALHQYHPSDAKPVPVDLVTASASGLDPHISPAAAFYQTPRVAKARGMDEAVVRRMIDEFTEGRQFGILGEPRVNVLDLNLALDKRQGPLKQ